MTSQTDHVLICPYIRYCCISMRKILFVTILGNQPLRLFVGTYCMENYNKTTKRINRLGIRTYKLQEAFRYVN